MVQANIKRKILRIQNCNSNKTFAALCADCKSCFNKERTMKSPTVAIIIRQKNALKTNKKSKNASDRSRCKYVSKLNCSHMPSSSLEISCRAMQRGRFVFVEVLASWASRSMCLTTSSQSSIISFLPDLGCKHPLRKGKRNVFLFCFI